MIAFTVEYNHETGELTKLVFSKAFNRESKLAKADVLKDALQAVKEAYAKADTDAFEEFLNGASNLKLTVTHRDHAPVTVKI